MMNVLKVSLDRTALQSVIAASMVQCHVTMLMVLVTAVTTGWVTTVRLKVCVFVILHTNILYLKLKSNHSVQVSYCHL